MSRTIFNTWQRFSINISRNCKRSGNFTILSSSTGYNWTLLQILAIHLTISLFGFSVISQARENAGPVLHYPFDAAEGDIVFDRSISGMDGMLVNGPVRNSEDSRIGNSLELNGIDHFVDVGLIPMDHPLQLNLGGTITTWFKANGGGDPWQRFIDKSTQVSSTNGYAVGLRPEDRSIWIVVDGNLYKTEANAYDLATWTHVAGIITQEKFEIYVNGTKAEGRLTRGKAVLPLNVETNMRIGTWNHSFGREFSGLLDDLRIYDRELSPQEIRELYKLPDGPSEITRIGYSNEPHGERNILDFPIDDDIYIFVENANLHLNSELNTRVEVRIEQSNGEGRSPTEKRVSLALQPDGSFTGSMNLKQFSKGKISITVQGFVSIEGAPGVLLFSHTSGVRVFTPVLQGVPNDVTISCGTPFSSHLAVTANDPCGEGMLPVFYAEKELGGCPRKIVRTWTTEDSCGNTTSSSQIITMEGSIAPELIAVPLDIDLECGSSVPVSPVVMARDSCTGNEKAAEVTDEIMGSNPLFVERTWFAADACDNSTSESQIITLPDCDTDFDGIGDSYEVMVLKTNPNVADSDGDGILDGQEDFDEDGKSNIEEYNSPNSCFYNPCIIGSSRPDNPDTDGDGYSDGDRFPENYEGLILGINDTAPLDPVIWDEENCITTTRHEFDTPDMEGVLPEGWEIASQPSTLTSFQLEPFDPPGPAPEEDVLRITARGGTDDRVKVRTTKTFKLGEYKWRIYIPKITERGARNTIAPFVDWDQSTDNNSREIDFEIGEGTAEDRKRYKIPRGHLICFMTVQKDDSSGTLEDSVPFLPENPSDHIERGHWYTYTLHLMENSEGRYLVSWFIQKDGGRKVPGRPSVVTGYGPGNTNFRMFCSSENLDFIGDHQPQTHQIGYFDFASHADILLPENDGPVESTPALPLITSVEATDRIYRKLLPKPESSSFPTGMPEGAWGPFGGIDLVSLDIINDPCGYPEITSSHGRGHLELKVNWDAGNKAGCRYLPFGFPLNLASTTPYSGISYSLKADVEHPETSHSIIVVDQDGRIFGLDVVAGAWMAVTNEYITRTVPFTDLIPLGDVPGELDLENVVFIGIDFVNPNSSAPRQTFSIDHLQAVQ